MRTIYFLFLSIFIPFLISCENDAALKEWKSIRKTDKAYPKDSITIDSIEFFNEVNWINRAYINYPYKKYFPEFVKLTFDIRNDNPFDLLNDSNGKYSIKKDILAVLKNKGITHMVSKRLTPKEFEVSLYLEKDSVSFIDCNEILENLNMTIPYTVFMHQDEEWNYYKAMIGN